ncbi:toxin HipA [Actinomycetota bacterium]|nr:toxin HipA [Actinomycetota bacterium]
MTQSALQVFDDNEYLGVARENSSGKIELLQNGRKVQRYKNVKFASLFDDLMPDEWASNMIRRTMYSDESLQKRVGGKKYGLSILDKVRVTKDLTRQGSLRFKEMDSEDFVYGKKDDNGLPVLDNVQTFGELSEIILEYRRRSIDKGKLKKLNEYVGSIGGARPKMSAFNSKGRLSIVKFTSSGDDSVGSPAGEALSIELAKLCGINVPEFQFFKGEECDAICIERFDRNLNDRIGYCSIYSLLLSSRGFKSSRIAMNTIARILLSSADVDLDNIEFFKRYAFTILINNTDDHLGNIGFLYNEELRKWMLSPQFDCVPDLNLSVSGRVPVKFEYGCISSARNRNLEDLIAVAEDFGIESATAKDIVDAMITVVKLNYGELIERYISEFDKDLYSELFQIQLEKYEENK